MTIGTEAAYEHDKSSKKTFKLKIIYNKNKCIGAGHCVLSDPYNWKLDEEFKADLVESKELDGPNKGVFVKTFETSDPHQIINAAKTCTPKVIAVIDTETGKRIAP